MPAEVTEYMNQWQDNFLSLFHHVMQKFKSLHNIQIAAVGSTDKCWQFYFLSILHPIFHPISP